MISSGIILQDVKQVLGLEKDYQPFDLDVSMHINTAFTQLHQMGVGKTDETFSVVTGEETWSDFFDGLPDAIHLQNVKTYVTIYTRLLFDPPTTSFGIDAIKKVLSELEWRMNLQVEVPSLKGEL